MKEEVGKITLELTAKDLFVEHWRMHIYTR